MTREQVVQAYRDAYLTFYSGRHLVRSLLTWHRVEGLSWVVAQRDGAAAPLLLLQLPRRSPPDARRALAEGRQDRRASTRS
jgi:hypothetical protein